MSRFPAPATIDEAPAASRPMLRAAEARFGRLPNMLRLLAVSPAALQGYMALLAALDQGTLGAQTSERVSLAVAEANSCQYCLSLHVHHARNRVGLDDAEITANRNGASNDLTADAAVRFAVKLAQTPKAVGDDDLAALHTAGFDDAEIIEIVLQVGLNTLASYVNKVGDPDLDFPLIKTRKAD